MQVHIKRVPLPSGAGALEMTSRVWVARAPSPHLKARPRWAVSFFSPRGLYQKRVVKGKERKAPETRAGRFYEQWHQYMHKNTAPDDVGMRQALLSFVKSAGKMEEYGGMPSS